MPGSGGGYQQGAWHKGACGQVPAWIWALGELLPSHVAIPSVGCSLLGGASAASPQPNPWGPRGWPCRGCLPGRDDVEHGAADKDSECSDETLL